MVNTLTKQVARAGFGEKTKFFLYVPPGSEEKAQKLLEDNNVSYARLRVYCVNDGILAVTPIKTPNSPYDHRRT